LVEDEKEKEYEPMVVVMSTPRVHCDIVVGSLMLP